MKNTIKTCATKALAAVAFGIAFSAQVVYASNSPWISINGQPIDNSGPGYTYSSQDGLISLTSPGATYTFAGVETNCHVRIKAMVGCTIVLSDGFTIDQSLSRRPYQLGIPDNEKNDVAAPIALATTAPVTVRVDGDVYLTGGSGCPGLRVAYGQTVILTQGPGGGRLHVSGGDQAAGIGSGSHDARGCGNIYIRCGVEASAVGDACAIGEGAQGWGDKWSQFTICIDDSAADVRAVASGSAAIGMCEESQASATIKISAGSVVARAGYRRVTGIGTGAYADAEGYCSIEISGGSVYAIAGSDCPAIGAGCFSEAVVDINISGGSVRTCPGTNAAGIGAGYKTSSDIYITISGGDINALDGSAENAAGIGGGYNSQTPSITISGGTIFAKGDSSDGVVFDIGAGRSPTGGPASCEVTGGNIYLENGAVNFKKKGTALRRVKVEGLKLEHDPVDVVLRLPDGTYYGTKDFRSVAGGNLFMWVPPAEYTGKMTVDGLRYDFDTTSGDATAVLQTPPPNDNFYQAGIIIGVSGRTGGTTLGASKESGVFYFRNGTKYSADSACSAWYSWTAPFSGSVVFYVANANLDVTNQIDVFEGALASSLQYISGMSRWVCTVEKEGFVGRGIRLNCTIGTTYSVKIYEASSVAGGGAFVVSWDESDKRDNWTASLGGDNTAKLTAYSGSSLAVTVPNRYFGCDVTEMCDSLFKNKKGITSVSIPSSVIRISDAAFYGCSAIESFSVASGNPSYKSVNGLLLLKDGKTLVHGVNDAVTIPDGVTKIDDSAFDGLTGLTSVTIPGSVTDIGYYAFYKCSGLKTVTIPDSVTRIEDFAFYKCTGLKTASLPGHFVGHLSSTVFSGCSSDLVITYRGDSFKVTLGKNGGKGGSDSVQATKGQAMPAATAPTLSGWTFAGYWDSVALDEKGNPKGKQYYDASMKSVRAWDKTSATTLWAKWTNKVTLGKNGGTGGDSYVTCTKGQPMPKRTMPTKSGYVFDGYWTTTGAGGVKYYNADGTSAHAWDKGGSVTLWAKWVAAVSCKVTFGKNGGTGGDSYVTATTGKAMPTPRTAPTLKGWSFGGYWDTLACDAKGNPLGKQYYNSKMESVRAWDKTTATTLWAKWTVKVTLGKNGGTGGDSTVTVIKGQPFPKRTMPTKSGYMFGGYFVSASSKTGQCYNPDGTGTASMKWTTGGTPTIWALWTKTSGCVELPSAVAHRTASAAPETAPQSAVSAGLYSGVLADGTGAFWLMLGEAEKDVPRTAYLYIASEDGILTAECTAEEADGLLLLTTDDGAVYAFDPAAGMLVPAA